MSIQPSYLDYPDFTELGDPVCASADPDMFFPEKGDPKSYAQIKMAKTACSVCPYQAACLAWALKNPDEQGIWGGTTEIERSRMRRNYTMPARKVWNGSGKTVK